MRLHYVAGTQCRLGAPQSDDSRCHTAQRDAWELGTTARDNALVRQDGKYIVLQSKDAIAGKLTPRVGATQQPGYGLRIVPLRYISPSEMAKLLKPYAKPDAFVSIDPNRSLLVLAGNPSELENYQRTIDTFDVDWLGGMSIGVFTMQHV